MSLEGSKPEYRLPEEGDLVSSAAPEPSSIIVPLCRLPSMSENEEFVSSPLYGLPATSLSGGDDGFVPSATPVPSSVVVPLYRRPAPFTSAEDDDLVPEPSTMLVPLIRLPAAASAENDGCVPSAVPEPSSITVPLFRLQPPSTPPGNDLVPSAAPEQASIAIPLSRLPGSKDDFVSPVGPALPSTSDSERATSNWSLRQPTGMGQRTGAVGVPLRPVASNLLDLPNELLLQIIHHLPGGELRKMIGLNRFFLEVGMNRRWQDVFIDTADITGVVHLLKRIGWVQFSKVVILLSCTF